MRCRRAGRRASGWEGRETMRGDSIGHRLSRVSGSGTGTSVATPSRRKPAPCRSCSCHIGVKSRSALYPKA